jgi:hypothetical protein
VSLLSHRAKLAGSTDIRRGPHRDRLQVIRPPLPPAASCLAVTRLASRSCTQVGRPPSRRPLTTAVKPSSVLVSSGMKFRDLIRAKHRVVVEVGKSLCLSW